MKKFLISLFLINSLVIGLTPSFAQDNSTLTQSPGIAGFEELKNQGITYYKWGKYSEALNYFEKIDKKTLTSEILLLMANCYDSQNNLKKSSELLVKAIEINPKNSFPYYNLGILYYKSNNIEEAIYNFKKAIKYNENFTAAYYNLGVCCYLIKDFKRAKDYFNNAINLNPDNADICYNLVLTYNALNNKKMAEKYLDIYGKLTEKYKKENVDNSKTNESNVKIEQPTSQIKEEKVISDKKQVTFWQNLNFLRKTR